MTQMQICFLGIGGSWPCKERSVPAVAIKRGPEIILFDCGEGTQRQFQKSPLSYMDVDCIFISHFHGDHFLGLPGLIQTMSLNDRKKPLHVYGPEGIKKLMDQLLHLGYFTPTYEIVAHELLDGEFVDCDEYVVRAFSVKHTVPTLGYALVENERPGRFNKKKALELGVPEGPMFGKLQAGQSVKLKDGKTIKPEDVLGKPRPGRKIVYSGDTAPCPSLLEAARGCDALIMDATAGDALKEKAAQYGHSTARQTAELAKEAGAKSLFLFHFSPRYEDASVLEKEAKEIFENSVLSAELLLYDVKMSE
jgi:ribonuclease Z